jgi:hypothetical protein
MPPPDPASSRAPSGADPSDPAERARATEREHAAADADREAGSDPADQPAAAAPGVREQLGRTKGAVGRLVSAHVNLAKAELADIMDEAKRAAMFGGMALGILIFVALLVGIGTILFIGEALFGSIGWGVLHGTLFLTAIAIVLGLAAIRFPSGPLMRGLAIGIVVGVVVAIVFGLDLTNRLWTAVGDAVAGNISADVRPLVVAVIVLGLLGAVVGMLLGARAAGGSGGVAGLVGGLVLGALLGAITATALGPRMGAAIGVTVALLVWLVMIAREVASRGIDTEDLKARYLPQDTIETTKETIEWVREQAPLGPKS